MLDGLRAADDGGIEHLLVVDFAGYLVGVPTHRSELAALFPASNSVGALALRLRVKL